MFQNMRQLHSRSAANRGVCVDANGAMLGPDCVLVQRTQNGFRALGREQASVVQKYALGAAPGGDWLFYQCQRISDALNKGELALAQIYGLRIPVAELDDRTLYRLALIDIGKAGFNPDEPRIPKGEPHAGEWTTGSSGDAGTDWSHDLSDNALLPDDPSSTGDIFDETFSTNTMPVAFSFEGDPQAAGIAEQATVAGSNPLFIAYPGDYHDAVVQALKDYLIQNGGVVITGVMLNAINGATAVADMVRIW